MATKNLIPRASGEGGIGKSDVAWGHAYYDTGDFNKGLFVSGKNIDQVIADAVSSGGLGGVWDEGAAGVIYYNGGNVGIGTVSPISPLTVWGANDNTSFDNIGNVTFIGTDAYNSNAGAGIIFGGRYNSGNDVTAFGQISIIKENNTDGDYKGALTLGTRDGSTTAMEKMRITSAGNVGIGTTNPSKQLHIQGTNASIPGIKISASDQGYEHEVRAHGDGVLISADSTNYGGAGPDIRFNVSGSEHMRIKKNGNVGIGTTDPSVAKLQIHGSSATAVRAGLLLNDSNGGRTSAIHQVGDLLQFDDYTQGITPMVINGLNGNVGIGTTSPEVPLMIKANSSADSMIKLLDEAAYVQGEARSQISFQGNDTAGVRTSFGGIEAYGASAQRGGLRFLSRPAASTTAVGMVLNEDSNVGIGTTNPGSQLSLSRNNSGIDNGPQDTAFSSIEVVTRNTSASANLKTGWLTQIGCYSLMNANGALPSKNALISVYRDNATSNEAATLRLSRSGDNAENYFWVDNVGNLRTGTTGSVVGSTGGTVVGTQTSDERIKKIEDSFEYGLNDVLKLKPIAFTLKEQKDGPRKLGFGAQSVQPIIPESVFDSNECLDGYDPDPEDESGTRQIPKSDQTKLGMEYTQLIPVLTKAIQEQQQLIEDLKSRIETLENK